MKNLNKKTKLILNEKNIFKRKNALKKISKILHNLTKNLQLSQKIY